LAIEAPKDLEAGLAASAPASVDPQKNPGTLQAAEGAPGLFVGKVGDLS